MTDELKDYLASMSKLLDGPIIVTIVYDPNGKDQKVFIIEAHRVSQEQR